MILHGRMWTARFNNANEAGLFRICSTVSLWSETETKCEEWRLHNTHTNTLTTHTLTEMKWWKRLKNNSKTPQQTASENMLLHNAHKQWKILQKFRTKSIRGKQPTSQPHSAAQHNHIYKCEFFVFSFARLIRISGRFHLLLAQFALVSVVAPDIFRIGPNKEFSSRIFRNIFLASLVIFINFIRYRYCCCHVSAI